MFTDQTVIQYLALNVPNKAVFDRPMSKRGRELLGLMLHWVMTRPAKKDIDPKVIINTYANKHDPLTYEETCQKYNMYKYKSMLKDLKPKLAQDYIDILSLDNLRDPSWSRSLELNDHRVGSISSPRSAEIYRWLTTHFLITDFNESDLNKISEFGQERFNLDVIKSEANKISDQSKHTIPYLYAIVYDVATRTEISKNQAQQANKIYTDRLAKIMQAVSEPKIQFKFDGDELERWERERQYLEVLSDLKNDK